MLVVHELVGRRRHPAVVEHLHALGPERPEVQPDRGRARPAVEREHERPLLGAARPVGRVGHEEDVGLDLALLVLEGHEAGGHAVLQDAPRQPELVLRGDGLLFDASFLSLSFASLSLSAGASALAALRRGGARRRGRSAACRRRERARAECSMTPPTEAPRPSATLKPALYPAGAGKRTPLATLRLGSAMPGNALLSTA